MQGPPSGLSAPAKPIVSVIVPAYGLAALVGESLRSVQAQELGDWEAIVIDDGDATIAPALLPFSEDGRIRLVGTGNAGVAAARNRAIAHARADMIALLDGDDLYEPGYLAQMMAAIMADDRHGFVTCDATLFGDSRDGQRFSVYCPQQPPITLARVLSRQFNVFTACVIRTAALEAVGGYDEGLRSGEDLDLWIRLLEAGWTAGHVDAPLVRYRRRVGSLSWDSMPMLEAVARVQAGAARRLADRPEGAIAAAALSETRRALACAEGEALIARGLAREGVAMLRQGGAHRRSPSWALAMAAMHVAPGLAGPLLRRRARAIERAVKVQNDIVLP